MLFGESGVNSETVVPLSKLIDNGDGLVLVSSNSLGDRISVVVWTAAGLAALSHPGSHCLGRTVEVDQVSNHHLISQPFLKLLPVLPIARKAVEKIPSVPALCDALLEEVDHKRGGQQFSFFHVAVNRFGKLASLLLLGPE